MKMISLVFATVALAALFVGVAYAPLLVHAQSQVQQPASAGIAPSFPTDYKTWTSFGPPQAQTIDGEEYVVSSYQNKPGKAFTEAVTEFVKKGSAVANIIQWVLVTKHKADGSPAEGIMSMYQYDEVSKSYALVGKQRVVAR